MLLLYNNKADILSACVLVELISLNAAGKTQKPHLFDAICEKSDTFTLLESTVVSGYIYKQHALVILVK